MKKRLIPFKEGERKRYQDYANAKTDGNFTRAVLTLIEIGLRVESEQISTEKQGATTKD